MPAGFRRDVEGLRAVAVLLVVLYHYGIPGLPGGFIGVDVFFVISGYLITGLLVSEIGSTGRIDLLRFYARRARRLLPALVLVAACTFAASVKLLSPLEQIEVAKAGAAAAGYVSNLWFAWRSLDYFAPEAGANPFLHTWSLGIEEQFYLAWPALILLFGTGDRKKLTAFLGLAAVASLAACVALTQTRQPVAFYLPLTRAWEFALGGLMYVLARPDATVAKWLTGAGLLVVATSAAMFNEDMQFPGWIALAPVLGTCAVLKGGEACNPVSSMLSGRVPVAIGRLSYSIYLWHWPVLVLAGVRWPEMDGSTRALWLGVATICAVISYRCVENPIRVAPQLAAPRRRAVFLWAGLTCSGVLLSAIAWTLASQAARDPEQVALVTAASEVSSLGRDPRGCTAGFLATDPMPCGFGSPSSSGEIVLVGDSHAGQWFTPIERFARSHGLQLTTYMKSSCAVADVPVFSLRLRREFTECATWRKRTLEAIAARRPRLVIVSQASFSYVTNQHTPNGRSQSNDPDAWESGLRRSLRSLTDSGVNVVLLADTPLMRFDVPKCLARGANPRARMLECSRPEQEAVNDAVSRAEQAAAAASRARYVSLQSHFCEAGQCAPMKGALVLYRDGNHMTEAYARSLYGPLAPMLQRALEEQQP